MSSNLTHCINALTVTDQILVTFINLCWLWIRHLSALKPAATVILCFRQLSNAWMEQLVTITIETCFVLRTIYSLQIRTRAAKSSRNASNLFNLSYVLVAVIKCFHGRGRWRQAFLVWCCSCQCMLCCMRYIGYQKIVIKYLSLRSFNFPSVWIKHLTKLTNTCFGILYM